MIEIGQMYKHYKGGEYKILALAKHSESLEEMVVYQNIQEPEKIWARPLDLFLQPVEQDGKELVRFQLQNNLE